jgi:hypothetical protein
VTKNGRRVVGKLLEAGNLFKNLVEAIEDAGGTEEDFLNLTRVAGRREAIGRLMFQESNTFRQVRVSQDRSPIETARMFEMEINDSDSGILTKGNFPALHQPGEGSSGTCIRMELIRGEKKLTPEEARNLLKENGLRPATLNEVVSLRTNNSGAITDKFPLFALGEEEMIYSPPYRQKMRVLVGVSHFGKSLYVQWLDSCSLDQAFAQGLFWAGVREE